MLENPDPGNAMVRERAASAFERQLFKQLPAVANEAENIIDELFLKATEFVEHVGGYYETVKKGLSDDGFTVPKTPSKAQAQARARGRRRRSSVPLPTRESPNTLANSRATRANTRAAAKKLDFEPANDDSTLSTSSTSSGRAAASRKTSTKNKGKAVKIARNEDEAEEQKEAQLDQPATTAENDKQKDDAAQSGSAQEQEESETGLVEPAVIVNEEPSIEQPDPPTSTTTDMEPISSKPVRSKAKPAQQPPAKRRTRSVVTKNNDSILADVSSVEETPVSASQPKRRTRASKANVEVMNVTADCDVSIPPSPATSVATAAAVRKPNVKGGVRKSKRRSSLLSSTQALTAAAHSALAEMAKPDAAEPAAEEEGTSTSRASTTGSKRTKPRAAKRASQLAQLAETQSDHESVSPPKKRQPAAVLNVPQPVVTGKSPAASSDCDDVPASPAAAKDRRFVRTQFSTTKGTPKKPAHLAGTPTRAQPPPASVGTGSTLKKDPRLYKPVAMDHLPRNTPPRKTQKEIERDVAEKAESIRRKQQQALQKKQNMLRERINSSKQKRDERVQKVTQHREEQERKQLEDRRRLQAKMVIDEARSPTKPMRSPMKTMRSSPAIKPLGKPPTQSTMKHAEAKPKVGDPERREQAEPVGTTTTAKVLDKLSTHEEPAPILSLTFEHARPPVTVTDEPPPPPAPVNKQRATKPGSILGAAAGNTSLNTSLLDNKGPIAKLKKEAHELPKKSPPKRVKENSYELTPVRLAKPASVDNYNIDNLNSEDETDDEDQPRKKVPDWANGSQFKASLIHQYYHPVNTDCIFRRACTVPDLAELFPKVQRRRFHKRTSSQYWDSPLWKSANTSRLNASRSESDLTASHH